MSNALQYDIAGTETIAERLAAQLPIPVGYHMLVALPVVQDKTKGGVFIAHETQAREETAAITGQVVAMGPLCYTTKQITGEKPWCAVTDWVVFKPYTGIRIVVGEREFRLMKDVDISAVVSNPAGIIRSIRS